MGGFRQVLVRLLLFQLDGSDQPQDGASPSFFPSSRNSILGLSVDV